MAKKLPTPRGSEEDVNSQVSEVFVAGRLKYFVDVWKTITNDPFILDIVEHCHINWKGSPPTQNQFARQNFNVQESLIIDREIKKLIAN